MTPTEQPNFRNTLVPDYGWYGHISVFAANARNVSYPYFMWNDRVYDSKTERDTGWVYDCGEFFWRQPE